MMPKVAYKALNFATKSYRTIKQANEIISEYASKGFSLTLRQLYYQFVARGFLPNTQKEYKNLGELVNKARLGGKIDWLHIVDRTRSLRSVSTWDDPASIIEDSAEQFRFDLWEEQEWRPEVWIEKDALIDVIAGVCNKWRVPYFSCRGYTSQSEQWIAAQRLARWEGCAGDGQRTVVFHLSDHDPSGMDMTRDIRDRFDVFGVPVKVVRVALTMAQVRKYKPPPNPAKSTDSRFAEYVREFGKNCWELDALNPDVLARMVTRKIEKILEPRKWKTAMNREIKARKRLSKVSKNWKKIEKSLDSKR